MFPVYDPKLQLDLHRQYTDELRRAARDSHLAREMTATRPGWWHRAARRLHPVIP